MRTDRLARVCALACLILVPLVMWLGCADTVETPKRLVVAGLAWIMLAGAFIRPDARRRLTGHPMFVPLAALVVATIFVNPTQFGPNEDLSKYPRTLDEDLEGCRRHAASAVFVPEVATMYASAARTSVHVAELTAHLCGASRPGHFDGVCTVVTKLFHIVSPDAAFFGQKDYQQAKVIGRMAADLDMPIRVVVCPIVRESDGLAMSSRNRYLSPPQRAQAVALWQALRLAGQQAAAGTTAVRDLERAMRDYLADKAPLGVIDYIEFVHPETLVRVEHVTGPTAALLAVKFPSARLIDNMLIDPACGG